jgi:transglutaminase-like putative cysteine protease
MRNIISVLLLATSATAFSADKKYPVSQIPDSLKKGMYAVIRESESVFTILDVNRSKHYVRNVITILNTNADRLATESVHYDKLTKVSFFKGAVYDAEGTLIKRLKANDIYDRSYVSSMSLYEDTRIKSASLEQATYPYTVEFEYEIENDYLYSLPSFYLYTDDEVSTQLTVYQIAYNKSYPPRYKAFNIQAQAKKTESDGRDILTWEFRNIIPRKFEAYGPELRKTVPFIIAAPSVFEYSNYRGNMNTWEDFAKWKADLLKGRDELPEETKKKIVELTKGVTSIEQKVKILYEYLQSKTRYVNISLGIGGLQPFPASVVDQVGYGDCKALSNYMISMLKVAGIQGLYTTIMAGANVPDVITDFPTHQSNHVIVSVPNAKDTIWLECTDQTKPYGYMGRFTDARKALINTPTGGRLVNTPHYSADQNVQSRTITVSLDVSGDAKANTRTFYKALQYENEGLSDVVNMGNDKQKEWLQGTTGIPNFDLVSFAMTNIKSRMPSAVVKTELNIRKLATVSGKRLFIIPNLMNRSSAIPPKVDNRRTDVVVREGYVDLDTVQFNLPDGIYPEFTPETIKHTSRFGEYEAQFKIEQNKLTYIRRMKMKDGVYPKESYNELIEFKKNVNKADNIKVVFVNKT